MLKNPCPERIMERDSLDIESDSLEMIDTPRLHGLPPITGPHLESAVDPEVHFSSRKQRDPDADGNTYTGSSKKLDLKSDAGGGQKVRGVSGGYPVSDRGTSISHLGPLDGKVRESFARVDSSGSQMSTVGQEKKIGAVTTPVEPDKKCGPKESQGILQTSKTSEKGEPSVSVSLSSTKSSISREEIAKEEKKKEELKKKEQDEAKKKEEKKLKEEAEKREAEKKKKEEEAAKKKKEEEAEKKKKEEAEKKKKEEEAAKKKKEEEAKKKEEEEKKIKEEAEKKKKEDEAAKKKKEEEVKKKKEVAEKKKKEEEAAKKKKEEEEKKKEEEATKKKKEEEAEKKKKEEAEKKKKEEEAAKKKKEEEAKEEEAAKKKEEAEKKKKEEEAAKKKKEEEVEKKKKEEAEKKKKEEEAAKKKEEEAKKKEEAEKKKKEEEAAKKKEEEVEKKKKEEAEKKKKEEEAAKKKKEEEAEKKKKEEAEKKKKEEAEKKKKEEEAAKKKKEEEEKKKEAEKKKKKEEEVEKKKKEEEAAKKKLEEAEKKKKEEEAAKKKKQEEAEKKKKEEAEKRKKEEEEVKKKEEQKAAAAKKEKEETATENMNDIKAKKDEAKKEVEVKKNKDEGGVSAAAKNKENSVKQKKEEEAGKKEKSLDVTVKQKGESVVEKKKWEEPVNQQTGQAQSVHGEVPVGVEGKQEANEEVKPDSDQDDSRSKTIDFPKSLEQQGANLPSAPPIIDYVTLEDAPRMERPQSGANSMEENSLDPRFIEARSSGNEKKEHLYKILVIGELGTGKTSIIKRYVHQFFSQHYRATIGVDFALKVISWDADTLIRLQLWDIAGQERFGNMTRVYYKEAVGAFVVFDVTRVPTFEAVVKWKNDLDSKVQLPDGSQIPCVLLANKCDQTKEGLVNNSDQMEEFCKEKGFLGWFETSAKENINIDEAARFLVGQILKNDQSMSSGDEEVDKDKIMLDRDNQQEASPKKSCCR